MRLFKVAGFLLGLFFSCSIVLSAESLPQVKLVPELSQVKTFENESFILRMIENSFEGYHYYRNIENKVPLVVVELFQKEPLKRIQRKELLRFIPLEKEKLDMKEVSGVYADLSHIDESGVATMIEFFPLGGSVRLIKCQVSLLDNSLTDFLCEERPESELKAIPEEE